ncbi:SRP54-type protein [Pelagophyceae sp. CCMP2097]|nr:SRP54-type protein [Pelagophyceae sp. CCMP2097]
MWRRCVVCACAALAGLGEAFRAPPLPQANSNAPAGRRRAPLAGGNVRGQLTKRFFFDQLAQSFSEATELLSGKKRITDKSIEKALQDVRRALVDADVSLVVVDGLVDAVRSKAVGMDVLPGVDPAQQFVKIMYDELVRVMGGDEVVGSKEAAQKRATLVVAPAAPTVVLLCGLQGAGKTTAAAKLASYLGREAEAAKAPKKTMLVAADVYRPAAVEQLKILGKEVGVEVYFEAFEPGSGDAVGIAQRGVERARESGCDTVIIDTAGRQVIDESLMTELKAVRAAVQPHETLLVLDAMTGQEAASLAARFDDACPLTGAILTKLDGDTRGGAALSVRAISGRPIKFVGVGERVEDLEPFYPARMASRILGMGDVVSLVEKAQRGVSKAQEDAMMAKLKNAQFDFNDYLSQSKMVAQMGSLGGIAKMMPGMGGIDQKQLAAAEKRIKTHEAMIASMTKVERADPELLIRDKTALSRIRRIAGGSGHSLDVAKYFVSDFQQMRQAAAPGRQTGTVAVGTTEVDFWGKRRASPRSSPKPFDRRIRSMMARMSNQNPAGAGDQPPDMAPAGNRALRRAAGKDKKAKPKSKGFG